MTQTHRLLAVLVAAIWGWNFLAIQASLVHFPPIFLAAFRWMLIAIPTLLFIPRPDVPVRYLLGYGIGFGALQFIFLYWGMAAGMPAGLASLVLQCSAPFTVILAAVFTREWLSRGKIFGIVVATTGLVVVASQRAGIDELWPFFLVVLGGLGWAMGNLASRAAKPADPLRFTLWMSVVPPLPLLFIAVYWEGMDRIVDSMQTVFDAPWAIIGLLYTCLIATVIGSGIWTWLLSRYPASTVAPFSMLVPVFGLSSALLIHGEQLNAVELLGGLLVLVGVLLGSRVSTQRVMKSAVTPLVASIQTQRR